MAVECVYALRCHTTCFDCIFNFQFQLNRLSKIIVIIILYRLAFSLFSFHFAFKSRTFCSLYITYASWTTILNFISLVLFFPLFFSISISIYLITVSGGMLIVSWQKKNGSLWYYEDVSFVHKILKPTTQHIVEYENVYIKIKQFVANLSVQILAKR